jgi:predicted transcriptional regulator of viral defense system
MSARQHLERLFLQHNGILRRTQVIEAGLRPHLLSDLLQDGQIERTAPGVYRLREAAPLEFDAWLEAVLRVPQGVVCLLSAAMHHQLTTFVPNELFLAIPNKAWRPRLEYPPIRYFYYSQKVHEYGVEQHPIGNIKVPIYSPEKTVADLLRYRSKLGEGLFIEALKTLTEQPNFRVSKLMDAARACKVEKAMQHYASVVLA